MKKRRNALLQGHLDKILWRVLDQYPKLVQQMIRHKSGVYALYRQDKLYYVDLAKNLMGRLRGHLKDRHRGAWDRFSVYLTVDADHMKQLESLLLRIAPPGGNRVSGGFGGPANLYRTLNRMVSRADADRRASLIGGWVARQRRAKAVAAGGSLGLAGLVDRRMALRGRPRAECSRQRSGGTGISVTREGVSNRPQRQQRRRWATRQTGGAFGISVGAGSLGATKQHTRPTSRLTTGWSR